MDERRNFSLQVGRPSMVETAHRDCAIAIPGVFCLVGTSATLSGFTAGSGVSRRLDLRLLEVSANLNFPVILFQC